LSASGRDNALGISPKQDEAAASKGLSQVYSNINGNVVTVSGYKNGGRTIVYQRDIVGAAAIDTLYWSYPATEKTQWDGPVTQTAHAFQPGDLTGHRARLGTTAVLLIGVAHGGPLSFVG